MTKYDHKFPVIKCVYLNCGYVTHYVFLCLAGSENVLFRSISSVDRCSLYKQQVFSTCDWLIFLFTIITLRSLMMKLRRIYDEVMTIIRFFENRAPEFLLAARHDLRGNQTIHRQLTILKSTSRNV